MSEITTAVIADGANLLGCEIAALRAVMEIEARGSGFDAGGRPIILPEPHVFWRELGPGDKRLKAANEGLAYPKWGQRPYPRSYAARWSRLDAMRRIDEDAANRSTSWGLGQIMGFNHKACGFDTVAAFVDAMHAGEAEQFMAMVRFIKSMGLAGDLRRRDWAGFARRYNGPGYKRNNYDTKLARAYARFTDRAAPGHSASQTAKRPCCEMP